MKTRTILFITAIAILSLIVRYTDRHIIQTKILTQSIVDCWIDAALPEGTQPFSSLEDLLRQSIVQKSGISQIRERMRKALYDVLLERMRIYRHEEKFIWKERNKFYKLESLSLPGEQILYSNRIDLGTDNFRVDPLIKDAIKRARLGDAILPLHLQFTVDPYAGCVETHVQCSAPVTSRRTNYCYNQTIFQEYMRKMAPPCPVGMYANQWLDRLDDIDKQIKESKDDKEIEKLNLLKKEVVELSVCEGFWG